MLIEIEEAVCFLASFLYGTIPRRRIDSFAEILANRLLECLMDQSPSPKVCHLVVNVAGRSDSHIQDAAEEAYMDLTEMQSLVPNNLILEIREGSVSAVNADTGQMKAIYPDPTESIIFNSFDNDDSQGAYGKRDHSTNSSLPDSEIPSSSEVKRRPALRVEYEYGFLNSEDEPLGRPYFELERDDTVYTAQTFAATRFGSTKFKSHQGVNGGNGCHPYTTPSLYAYIQLLIFLNALACLTLWSDKVKREDNDKKELQVNGLNTSVGKHFPKMNGNITTKKSNDSA